MKIISIFSGVIDPSASQDVTGAYFNKEIFSGAVSAGGQYVLRFLQRKSLGF
jgi:hypothetical protein